MKNNNESIKKIWQDFITKNPQYGHRQRPASFYFCSNQKAADDCAQLVVKGIKQATTSSKWHYDFKQEKFASVGDMFIITDWCGKACAIIEITHVELTNYNKITEAYAGIEGEGDQSLAHWRKVHWTHFSQEMAVCNEEPTADMPVVCEYFKTVWIASYQPV
ncbi:MAG TPA: ASCH domain-containing protein [Oceanospirillales bacterium]|nr:ASCH domain-containing protein [Oceanospirillales bacterium]